MLCEATALVQLRGLGISKSLDVSVEAEPVCGLSGSRSAGPGGLSFHLHFLVAGLGLGKRRKPRPAGYVLSCPHSQGGHLGSCLRLPLSSRTGWLEGDV